MKLFGWHGDYRVDLFTVKIDYLFLGVSIMSEYWVVDDFYYSPRLYEKRLFGVTVWRAKW